MELLALDFDGVISDSAPESFLVALRTYCELRPESRLVRERDRAEGLGAAGIRADPSYGHFLALMPLGNRAEDFAVALSILDARLAVGDQAAYDRVYASVALDAPDFLEPFHRRFYQVRCELRRKFDGLAEFRLDVACVLFACARHERCAHPLQEGDLIFRKLRRSE